MKELLYNVWLSLACTAGSGTFSKLLGKFKSAEEIYFADGEAIASCVSSKLKDYKSLTDKSTGKAEKIIDFCQSREIGILSYFDRDFPSSLRNIKNPPVLLYYRGKLPDFENGFFLAIVGMRHLSDYGRRNTFKISGDIARAGATVVSGMARGIDGVALAAAIAEGKSTVAVMGTGIDLCYPPHHRRLAREIVKNGCVITEYAPGTRAHKGNFPIRNRIVSALSKATLVMEGTENSGSLITARHAREQGRAVYAFPGNVGNSGSEATNLLIKNGAKLLTSADDIVRDFEKESLGKLSPFKLLEKSDVDMHAVLSELQVSCVAVDDSIFKVGKRKPQKEKENLHKTAESRSSAAQKDCAEIDKRILSTLGKSTFELYKKIPVDSDVSVEELIDELHSLREVMKGILALEIGGFVTMLPGDRVKRK